VVARTLPAPFRGRRIKSGYVITIDVVALDKTLNIGTFVQPFDVQAIYLPSSFSRSKGPPAQFGRGFLLPHKQRRSGLSD
jgi:hypothetical protein